MTAHFQVTLLPRHLLKHIRNKRVGRNLGGKNNVVRAYFGLPPEVWKSLENRVKNSPKSRSHTFRKALDFCFLKQNQKQMISVLPTCEKSPPIGLKTISVTIRKDQDQLLRMMSEKTGKNISRLGREALEQYLEIN